MRDGELIYFFPAPGYVVLGIVVDGDGLRIYGPVQEPAYSFLVQWAYDNDVWDRPNGAECRRRWEL